ncbi:MAG: hypothetical protein IJF80_06500 [Clostridia bacterium]|nr:hypothetical protein [Clostridia bacterium]
MYSLNRTIKKLTAFVLAIAFVLMAVMPSFAQNPDPDDEWNPDIVIIEDDISMGVALQRFNAVRNRFYTHTEVADRATMRGDSSTLYVFNTPSYTLLAARILKALSEGNTDMRITYEFVPFREYSDDTFKAPMVSKEMYLDMADEVLAYYAETGSGAFDYLAYPNDKITEYSGNISAPRVAGILSWALAYYYNNGVLPEYITTAYKRNERVAIELREESFYVLDYSTDYLKNVPGGTTIEAFLKNFVNRDLYVADEKGNRITDNQSIVRTGWCVCRENEETILDSIVMLVNGDVNADGYGNETDSDIITDAILNGTKHIGITKDVIDVDRNKKINALDLLAFQRAVKGMKNKTVTYNYTAAENAFNLTADKHSISAGEEFKVTISAPVGFKARRIGAMDFSIRINTEFIELVSFKLPDDRSADTVKESVYNEDTKEFRFIWSDAAVPINKIDRLMEITFKAKQDISEIWPSTEMPIYFVSNKSSLYDSYGNKFEFRMAKRYLDEEIVEPIVTPEPEAVFTLDEATAVLMEAGKEYEETGTVPESLTFGEITANKASYFRVACEALTNLLDANENDVPYYTCTEPQGVEEARMSSDTMSKLAYSNVVKRQLAQMNTLTQENEYLCVPAPFIAVNHSYGINGRMDYNRTLITVMRIFSYLAKYGELPENIDIAMERKTYAEVEDIISASKSLIDYYDENFILPQSVILKDELLNMSQFFDVCAKAVSELSNTGAVHRVILQDCTELTWTASDSFVVNEAENLIGKEGYVHFVEQQLEQLDKYSRRQPLMTVEFEETEGFPYSGSMNFTHQLLVLARIMRSFRKTGILPESISADYETARTSYEIPMKLAITACASLYEAYQKDMYAQIPSSKTVEFTNKNGEEVKYIFRQATYAEMAAEVLKELSWDSDYKDLPETITVYEVTNPINPVREDTFEDEVIDKDDYLYLGKAYAKYVKAHANQAPTAMKVNGLDGSLCFDRITVIMLRAISNYAIRRTLGAEVITDYKSDIVPPTPTPTAEATSTPEPTLPVPSGLTLKAESTYVAENGKLKGVEEKTSLIQIITAFDKPENIEIYDNLGNKITEGDALVGTGAQIRLVIDGEVVDTLDVAIVGDLTGDGKINSRDIAAIQKIILGTAQADEITTIAGDMRTDKELNSRDIAALQKKVIGI